MTTATWTKLNNGNWGVRVPGRATVGQTITVAKKSGATSTETISAVLWTGIAKDGREASLVSIVAKPHTEPRSIDGNPAIYGQHWSSRGKGPVERLCAGGCGRRVSAKFAECYSCHRESMDAM